MAVDGVHASETTVAPRRPDRRGELRDFLRSRRARISPAEVGLIAGSRRRTPGLRREEVALLAGVGVSWYTWLEQGRNISASPAVLDAISTTLKLTDAERVHLYLLANANPPARSPADHADSPSPELVRLVEAWAPRPAMLQDRHWNLLAVNDGVRALFGYGEADRNCLITFFTNRRYRDMYVEWEAAAPGVVAAFRADAAQYPNDTGFGTVVDALGRRSPEFVELWDRHDVGPHLQTVKAVRHPAVGELVFDKTTLALADHVGWHLVLYDPRPGTDTETRLARLTSHAED